MVLPFPGSPLIQRSWSFSSNRHLLNSAFSRTQMYASSSKPPLCLSIRSLSRWGFVSHKACRHSRFSWISLSSEGNLALSRGYSLARLTGLIIEICSDIAMILCNLKPGVSGTKRCDIFLGRCTTLYCTGFAMMVHPWKTVDFSRLLMLFTGSGIASHLGSISNEFCPGKMRSRY